VSHSSYRRALSWLCALPLIAGTAHADPVAFGPTDVPTVFYIAKSNNRDRVDYGTRLDEGCHPASTDATFPYWRDLERSPASVHTMSMFARMAYGFSAQHIEHQADGAIVQRLVLKQMSRPIWVTTAKTEDGHCKAIAWTKIAGVDRAELVSIYVKLAGPLSVEYVDVKGRNRATGELLAERIKH
jgi:Domain of unknown function (DUF4833)